MAVKPLMATWIRGEECRTDKTAVNVVDPPIYQPVNTALVKSTKHRKLTFVKGKK